MAFAPDTMPTQPPAFDRGMPSVGGRCHKSPFIRIYAPECDASNFRYSAVVILSIKIGGVDMTARGWVISSGLISSCLLEIAACGLASPSLSKAPVKASPHAAYGSRQYAASYTHVAWVESSQHAGRLCPIYNLNLAMNQHMASSAESFKHWVSPPRWSSYLEWNQKLHAPSFFSAQGYLFITLQGTVYIYHQLSQSGWPIHPFADIPPGATIVAAYVPLSSAVKDGILPVYNGQPWMPGMKLPEIWQSSTHLAVVPTKPQ